MERLILLVTLAAVFFPIDGEFAAFENVLANR